MAAVRQERSKITKQLAELSNTLEVGRQVLASALALLADPKSCTASLTPTADGS
jgi:hypothetical protein